MEVAATATTPTPVTTNDPSGAGKGKKPYPWWKKKKKTLRKARKKGYTSKNGRGRETTNSRDYNG